MEWGQRMDVTRWLRVIGPHGAGPVIRVIDQARHTWDGRIVTRAFPAALTEDEYCVLCAGGKRRLAQAERTAAGAPRLALDAVTLRQVERDLDRLALDRVETHNAACNVGRTVLLNFLANVGGLSGVQYFAVGTGNPTAPATGPSATDTQLWNEVFRKAITSATTSGNQELLNTFFATGDGNATYTEAGIFGNGASSAANSGTIFAHANYSYNKTSAITLSNNYYVNLT